MFIFDKLIILTNVPDWLQIEKTSDHHFTLSFFALQSDNAPFLFSFLSFYFQIFCL